MHIEIGRVNVPLIPFYRDKFFKLCFFYKIEYFEGHFISIYSVLVAMLFTVEDSTYKLTGTTILCGKLDRSIEINIRDHLQLIKLRVKQLFCLLN